MAARPFLLSLAVAVVVVATASCGDGGGAGTPPQPEGSAASGSTAGGQVTEVTGAPTGRAALAALSAPGVLGGRVSGADLAGRDAVVWFWSPW